MGVNVHLATTYLMYFSCLISLGCFSDLGTDKYVLVQFSFALQLSSLSIEYSEIDIAIIFLVNITIGKKFGKNLPTTKAAII